MKNFLQVEEFNQFINQGYLLIKNAITDNTLLDRLEHNMNRIDESVRDSGYDEYRDEEIANNNHLIYPNFINEDKSFLDLAILPTIFPKIWGILGWNIYCYYSDLAVTPGFSGEPGDIPPSSIIKDWHRDSGRVNSEVMPSNPRLSIKVAYFISNCHKQGMGNMYLSPSSHHNNRADFNSPRKSNVETLIDPDQHRLYWKIKYDSHGMVPILANRGDALIFDRRIWHSRSKNLSQVTRKVLFYGYCYRWLVGHRYCNRKKVEEVYGNKLPSILEQMLGIGATADNAYYPTDDIVPLRAIIRKYEKEGLIEDGKAKES